MKFFSSQNTAGVSQEKGIAVISQTMEVNGDQVLKVQKIHENYKMPPYSLSEVI